MDEFLVWLLVIATLLALFVWLIRKLPRRFRRRPSIGCKLKDIPLTNKEWERFAGLAIAKGVTQKTLLAEAIIYYLEQKTK